MFYPKIGISFRVICLKHGPIIREKGEGEEEFIFVYGISSQNFHIYTIYLPQYSYILTLSKRKNGDFGKDGIK